MSHRSVVPPLGVGRFTGTLMLFLLPAVSTGCTGGRGCGLGCGDGLSGMRGPPMDYTKDQVLIELRRHHAQLLSFADALDGKLSGLTQAGVVILTLFSVIGAVGASSSWFWPVLGIAAIAFLAGTVISALSQTPQEYAFPLVADWDTLACTYFPLGETDMRYRLISQYLEAIDVVKKLLAYKAKCVRIGTIALSFAMTVLVVLQVSAVVFSEP